MQRLSDEHGAVAVMIGLLMVVIVGTGAMTVDVGNLYWERRQLQNGADAAALAAAQDHATGQGARGEATARSYADANNTRGAYLEEYRPGDGRVTVVTRTGDIDQAGWLRSWLAGVLGRDQSFVRATATAAWGGPARLATAIPVTFSRCEWEAYTAMQGGYAPPPPYDDGWPTETVVMFHDTTGSAPPGCGGGPVNADLPGGFGYLKTVDNRTCAVESIVDDWFADSTGNSVPNGCSNDDFAALVGTVIPLSVFDQVNGLTGNNGEYQIGGYAAFYLTGYYLGGPYRHPSLVTGTLPCGADPTTGSQRCLSGFFTEMLLPSDGVVSGPSYGVNVIQLVD
jgi:type II secretory pathway pseudopilin PulG